MYIHVITRMSSSVFEKTSESLMKVNQLIDESVILRVIKLDEVLINFQP